MTENQERIRMHEQYARKKADILRYDSINPIIKPEDIQQRLDDLWKLITLHDLWAVPPQLHEEMVCKASELDKENSDLKSQLANAKRTAQEQREIIAREEEGRKELLAICDRKDAEIKDLIKRNNAFKENEKEYLIALKDEKEAKRCAIEDIRKNEALSLKFSEEHKQMEFQLTRFGIVWAIVIMLMFFISGFGLVLVSDFYTWYVLLGVSIATIFFLAAFLFLSDIANSDFTFGQRGSRRRAFAHYVIVCPISFFFGRVRGHQLRAKNALWAFDVACVPQMDGKGVVSMHRIDLNEWEYDSETNRLMPKKQDHDKPTR